MALGQPALADASAPPIRIGVLAFGTLNWEITALRHEGLDKARGLNLETTTLASAEAGKIALQGGSVDMIVGDWIWVAKQRQQGLDFSFAPYSTNHGALMVPAQSPIQGVADLKGQRLGIAGGGLDKNWRLLRALAHKTQNLDLDQAAQKTFAAPPLLNQELRQGQLDAVLNYWNYAAQLEAAGYRRVLDGRDIARGLGIAADVPGLGYTFRESWAKTHTAELTRFLKAADEAKQLICTSDSVWKTVAPTDADPPTQAILRRYYCEGRVVRFGAAEQQAAGEIFNLVEGKPTPLPAGVFWSTAH